MLHTTWLINAEVDDERPLPLRDISKQHNYGSFRQIVCRNIQALLFYGYYFLQQANFFFFNQFIKRFTFINVN